MRNLHLLCNAHLDPAWLWEIEEGAGEALSTFRIAAEFCEQYDDFVFNHNEAILYQWVEEYDPALFKRIQALVKAGKWHIMGGWYLQPDCNMPSGESFVRQIMLGKRYFREKFSVNPTTAINFDPFGHTRGLVQIMVKAGYDSYIVCRPGQEDCPLPADEVAWVGADGSEMTVHRAYKAYLSGRGKAHLKVESYMADHPDEAVGLVLWGIGNHGGGPSREDLHNLRELKQATQDRHLTHSTPEAYFRELHESGVALPRYEGDLNPWAVGCYTSQIRIKQKHRQLENDLYMVEKMMSACALQRYLPYPEQEIGEALRDLLTAQFHDILPGSSIRPVEEASLRLLDHGLEIVSRLRARAFFALTSGEPRAEEGEVPIFVYNPHPYPVRGIFECEYQLASSSKDRFAAPVVRQGGKRVPAQAEQELSHLYIEWRKRVVFAAELAPGAMNRFDVTAEWLPAKPAPQLLETDGAYRFRTGEIEVVISTATGLIDEYKVNGVSYLRSSAALPIVLEDRDDAWGSHTQSFGAEIGQFKRMSESQAGRYAGTHKRLKPVRVIEDGEARTVVEALLAYGDSAICMTYKLPKRGTELEIGVTVHWNEKRKMLKLAFPTMLADAAYVGQGAYSTDRLPGGGREAVAQKWVAAVSGNGEQAVTLINDGTYGSDVTDGAIRLSLLRSPGYSALPGGGKTDTMPQDRYSDRIDQGERKFTFWLNAGPGEGRLAAVEREALSHNEKPYALAYFPGGEGRKPEPLVALSDEAVVLAAFKKAEGADRDDHRAAGTERGDYRADRANQGDYEAEVADQGDYIIRLFEPTGLERTTTVRLPFAGMEREVRLAPFEIVTLRLDADRRTLTETGLLEEQADLRGQDDDTREAGD